MRRQFCCLWHNVEASCHKYFVIFSRSQHRRILPAMCHNLQYGGHSPPATVLTTPACCSINSIAVKKPDIGSESQFLPTPLAFDAPFIGVPVGLLLCRLAWKKLEWCGYPTVKNFWYIYSFWQNSWSWQTHTQADTQTPHDDIGRDCIASRGKNLLHTWNY